MLCVSLFTSLECYYRREDEISNNFAVTLYSFKMGQPLPPPPEDPPEFYMGQQMRMHAAAIAAAQQHQQQGQDSAQFPYTKYVQYVQFLHFVGTRALAHYAFTFFLLALIKSAAGF